MSQYNIKFGTKLDTSNLNEEIKKVTESVKSTPIELSIKISAQDKDYLNTVKEVVSANQQVQESVSKSTDTQKQFTDALAKTKSQLVAYNNDVINTTGSIREFVASNSNMMDADTISEFERLHSVIATLINEGDIDKLNRYKQELKELKTSFNTDKKATIVDTRDSRELNNLINQMKNLKNTKDKAYERNPELLTELEQLAGKAQNLSQNFDNVGNRRAQITGLKTEFANLRTSINGAQQQTMSFSEQLKEAINKFSVWSGVTTLYFKAIEGIKAMISNVTDLDASLTELKKVTDLNDEALSSLTTRAYEAGVEIGRTGREVLDAMQIFSQAGYEVESAFDLAKVATTMVNVGDGIDDVDQSAKVLISTMKGFGIESDRAIEIVDTLNKVSNTSAISFGDLAEGMTRVSAVMNQADVSIEQTTGLLTGSNEIIQNIEKSSSGLITISQRLRGISEAGDETAVSVATMGDAFKDIANVDILDETTGQLRSTYDILNDLAEVYPSLTKNQQQYLGELAAGKRQVNVLQALLQNWEAVDQATANAYDSAGSAQKEQEAYLNSIQGKMSQLQSAFEQLSVNTIDSGVVKFFVEIATAIVNVVDKIGILNVALFALFAIINKKQQGTLVMSLIEKAPKAISTIVTGIKSLTSQIATYITTSKKASSATTEVAGAMTAEGASAGVATASTLAFDTALKTIMTTIAPLILAVIALNVAMSAISAIGDWLFTSDLDRASEALAESKERLQQLQSEYDALTQKAESGELTAVEEKRLELLEKQIEAQERLNEAKTKDVVDEAGYNDESTFSGKTLKELTDATNELAESQDGYNTTLYTYQDVAKSNLALVKDNATGYETLTALAMGLNEEQDSLLDQMNKLADAGKTDTEEFKKLNAEYETNVEIIQSVIEKASELDAEIADNEISFDDLGKSMQDANLAFYDFINTVDEAGASIEDANSALEENVDIVSWATETYNQFETETDLLATAFKEMAENGQLSTETVMKMIEAGGKYTAMLETEGSVVRANMDLLLEKYNVSRNSSIEEVRIKKAEVEAKILAVQAEISAYDAAEQGRVQQAKSSAEIANAFISTVETHAKAVVSELLGVAGSAGTFIQNAVNQVSSAFGGIGGGSGFDALQSQLTGLQNDLKALDALEASLSQSLDTRTGATDKSTNATKGNSGATKENTKALEENKKAQEALQAQIDKTKEALERENEAFEQKKKWNEVYTKNVIKILEKEIDLLEKEKDAVQERYDAEIQAIKDKITLLDETADREDKLKKIQEAQLDVAKKQQALEEIRKNRNVRTYVEGKPLPQIYYIG